MRKQPFGWFDAMILAMGIVCMADAMAEVHISGGRMAVSGLSGQGTVLEVGKTFGPLTAALIAHQGFDTDQAQNVKSGLGGYVVFLIGNTDKWQTGIGAAYLDVEVTDHHGLRALFGVPPLTGDSDALEAGIAVNRRFGPLFVGLRHFGFTSLNVGVRF